MMARYGWPAAPLVLGIVLGNIFENAMRKSLTLSRGRPWIFFTRLIAAYLLVCSLVAVLLPPL